MKTMTNPTVNQEVINPGVIALGLIMALLVFLGITGKIAFLANLRLTAILLLVVGMAMCTSGIGRVAATNAWAHPLSILAYLLGGAIFIAAAGVVFNWNLPLIHSGKSAVIAIAALSGMKILVALLHSFLSQE